ncbi:MAG: winged helix-turn-helix transcriptional regulator [Actinobacteria bacterium]|nr:winged helix-turn-helix transcriptional regulator [Actinomycetota bacterium]
MQTRPLVQQLLERGLEQSEIARQLGLTKSTVAYHVRTLGRPVDLRFARRYDWSEVQSFYDERPHSLRVSGSLRLLEGELERRSSARRSPSSAYCYSLA